MTSSNNTYISELKDTVGWQVTISGWLYNSRGSGKVRFKNLEVYARARQEYSKPLPFKKFDSIQALAEAYEELLSWLAQAVPTE